MLESIRSIGRRLGIVPPETDNRLAGILLRPEILLVHAYSKTTAGVHLVDEPVLRLNPSADPNEVGAAIRQVLAAYRTGVPHPKQNEWAESGKPFLAAAGFRSWRSLEAGAKSCHVTQKPDGSFSFSIFRNGGTRGEKKGFQPFGVPDRPLKAGPSDTELGLALREALQLCE